MISASIALARILKAEGVEQIFCFPTTEIIEAAAVEGIRVITTRTERIAVNMADAYTRMHNGRRIGVCAVQAGPGTENAFVGVAQAYADSSPILLLTGGATRERVGLPALSDTLGHYRGVTKWADTINARVDQPKEIVPAIKRAIEATRKGTPAVLEFMSKVEYSSSRLGATLP